MIGCLEPLVWKRSKLGKARVLITAAQFRLEKMKMSKRGQKKYDRMRKDMLEIIASIKDD